MAAHPQDLHTGRGVQADVDPPRVITVDEHAVRVTAVEQLGVELHQSRAVLGLHHAQHIGVQVRDDPGRHPDRDLVDGLGHQLDPTRPVGPAGGDDPGFGVRRCDQEVTPVLPEQRPRLERLRIGSDTCPGGDQDPQRQQRSQHVVFVLLAVLHLRGKGIEGAVRQQDRSALRPGRRSSAFARAKRFSTLNDANLMARPLPCEPAVPPTLPPHEKDPIEDCRGPEDQCVKLPPRGTGRASIGADL